VLERGSHELWEVHSAYYYRSLSVQGAIDGGFNNYGFTHRRERVHLPTYAYHLQFGYFLTGEQATRRTFVEPRTPFAPFSGKRGFGAWEVQSRFDHFQVGNEVFAQELANGDDWTNNVNTIDVGFNWYWNKYIKVIFDWQHSSYASPVLYAPGRFHTTSDLLWGRIQLYF
jgi:phosphate-selective porin OprO/OprP